MDSFQKPRTESGATAWAQLILNLLFLRPGTYPSMPLMGIDIEKYQYDYVDDVVTQINAAIVEQHRTFLPDIPLTGTDVSIKQYQGQDILVIYLSFSSTAGNQSAVIAANISPNRILDFDVSW